jgi:hypothetical protein
MCLDQDYLRWPATLHCQHRGALQERGASRGNETKRCAIARHATGCLVNGLAWDTALGGDFRRTVWGSGGVLKEGASFEKRGHYRSFFGQNTRFVWIIVKVCR